MKNMEKKTKRNLRERETVNIAVLDYEPLTETDEAQRRIMRAIARRTRMETRRRGKQTG